MDPIQKCAYMGQLEKLKELYQTQSELFFKQYTSPQKTPLFYATIQNNDEIVSFLISIGLSTTFPLLASNKKLTLLHYATSMSSALSLSMYKALLSAPDLDINSLSEDGCTPLHNLTNYTLEDSNIPEEKLQTHLDKVELLLKFGANPNAPSPSQNHLTPLHNAIISGHIDLVKLLIKFGGDLTKKTGIQLTSLHLSSSLSSSSLTSHILSHPSVNREVMLFSRDSDGQTPLHTAVQHSSLENVRVLLDLSNFQSKEKRTEFVNIQDNDGVTSLIMTCSLPLIIGTQIGRELLSCSSSISCCDESGFGPLHAACSSGNFLLLYSFFSSGVDIDIEKKTVEGDTPAHLASSVLVPIIEDLKELEQLKTIYKEIMGKNWEKYSATEHLEILYERGMNPDIENNQKLTPLHYAISSGLAENVQYLIGIGSAVDINVIDLEKYLDSAIPARKEHYKTDPSNFADISYWDRYYKHDSSPFEWYQSYKPIRKIVEKYYPNFDDNLKCLLTGCGTSELGYYLYSEKHFSKVWSMDLSEYVIKHMKSIHPPEKYPGLVYDLMDVQKMTYSDGFFDCLIDKGMLDCFYCSDEVDKNVESCLAEVSRVLKPNGIFILVTWGGPEHRLPHLQLSEFNFKVLSINSQSPKELPQQENSSDSGPKETRSYARLFYNYVLIKNQ